jgi:hypothetical protein
MTRGIVDVYAHAMLTPGQAAEAHAAMDRLDAQPGPGESHE